MTLKRRRGRSVALDFVRVRLACSTVTESASSHVCTEVKARTDPSRTAPSHNVKQTAVSTATPRLQPILKAPTATRETCSVAAVVVVPRQKTVSGLLRTGRVTSPGCGVRAVRPMSKLRRHCRQLQSLFCYWSGQYFTLHWGHVTSVCLRDHR